MTSTSMPIAISRKFEVNSLVPQRLPFANIEPTGFHIAFQANPDERIQAIRDVTNSNLSFAGRVNQELARLSPYYQAVGQWANYERRSFVLAEHLGMSELDFKKHLGKHNHITTEAFRELCGMATAKGVDVGEILGLFKEIKAIQPKAYARQRMLMMRTLMNSTPIIVADLLEGKISGNYGFGDLTKTQVFNGKAQIGNLQISATASPRLFKTEGDKNSGYVFRFCVGKCLFDTFEEDHPLYMLDNKVVESLSAWHQARSPGEPLSANPLLQSMVYLLTVPTHDWGHSWLLYDLGARTEEFQKWGNSIYNVEHTVANKLLINYELITASMHNYTWRMLFDANPSLKDSIANELTAYHAYVKDFSEFVKTTYGPERAFQEENYLMYVALSTLPCVLDRSEPVLSRLRAEYPIVQEQTDRILGDFFKILSSNEDGVPSSGKSGDFVGTGEYVSMYPLQSEMEARLLEERKRALINSNGTVRAEYLHAFRALPESIVKQFPSEIPDLTVLPTLVSLMETFKTNVADLPDAKEIFTKFVRSIVVAESGHFFFRLERQDIDYENLQICLQDKRVMLVEVPEGEEVDLRTRIMTSLKEEVTKQRTKATDQDVIAFNVQSPDHAKIILDAGEGLAGTEKIQRMIAVAKDLALLSSIEGAQDIYPLRLSVAKDLYKFQKDGYYESLNRERLACSTVGPLELSLHDGSQQKTLAGALVYLENKDALSRKNQDKDPDIHGIEQGVFDQTYLSTADSLVPFTLRQNSTLSCGSNCELVTKALHQALTTLREINLQIDHGESASLASGLFGRQ